MMEDTPTPEMEISTQVTHTVMLHEAEPTVMFYQAQTEAQRQSQEIDLSETILGETDFVIWQHTPSTVSLPSGLYITPP